MPSAPKIQKETILETAFKILIRDGYEEVNIKNVAKELDCSTQPISWQFGGMDNFRKELLQYCVTIIDAKFSIGKENAEQMVDSIVATYIDLVYDTPNLYKYLYMDGGMVNQMGDLTRTMRTGNKGEIIDLLAKELDISIEAAMHYLMNVEFYVHGIAAYVASGFISLSKEEAMNMICTAREAFRIKECQGSN